MPPVPEPVPVTMAPDEGRANQPPRRRWCPARWCPPPVPTTGRPDDRSGDKAAAQAPKQLLRSRLFLWNRQRMRPLESTRMRPRLWLWRRQWSGRDRPRSSRGSRRSSTGRRNRRRRRDLRRRAGRPRSRQRKHGLGGGHGVRHCLLLCLPAHPPAVRTVTADVEVRPTTFGALAAACARPEASRRLDVLKRDR